MITLIPTEYYSAVFYFALFLIIVVSLLKLLERGYVINNPKKKKYGSLLLLFSLTLYIGLRPVDPVFVDMETYNSIFEAYASGSIELLLDYDILWQFFIKTCSSFFTAQFFFLLCALIYIIPLYLASKKWLGVNHYFLFLMFIASFSFWSYGVNGIRNGISTSLFVLALSSTKKKYFKYGLFVISYYVHASLIIPLAAFVLTLFFKNPKHYFYGWLLCIPLSLVLGSFFEAFFGNIGFQEDRLSYLTQGNVNNDYFSYTGFRWDFLAYSSSATIVGYYFIIKKKFNDKIYIQVFNIYLAVNGFWILVIRANFSNRFAYLSWFLIAFVIFYPFFKARFFKNQNRVLAGFISAYFAVTYFLYLIF